MDIQTLAEGHAAAFDALVKGVRQYNTELMGKEASLPLTVVAKDTHGELIGGVGGRTIYRQFLVEVVWVDKKHRGSGLGAELMQQAESEAIGRGCVAAQVDTLACQAAGFYQKLGFEIVGQMSDIAPSPDRFFLLKRYS